MARRLSQIASLLDGFNTGYETVGRIGRDIDMNKVAAAKPTEDVGFTPDQGAQLHAAADSGQYDVQWDTERGQYTVRPKASPEMVGQVAPGRRTTFLGKTYDQAPDDAMIQRDRSLAMAGVLEKHGDPTAGLRMRDMIRQGDIADEGLKIQRERGKREAELAPLQIEQATLGVEAARRTGARDARVDTIEGTLQSKWAERLATPDGGQRQPTMDDQLWLTEQRVFAASEAGDMKGAQEAMQAHSAQALAKITQETRERSAAVDQAAAGVMSGNMNGAIEVYNRFLPDGAKVISATMGKDGKITIEREVGGVRMRPETRTKDQMLTDLQAIKSPETAWQMTRQLSAEAFQARAERRADASLGLQQAAHAAGADGRNRDATIARLQTERLDPKTTPERRAQIDDLLMRDKGADTNAPAVVKLAQAAVQAGLAQDMRGGLEWARTSTDKSEPALRAEIYGNFAKTLMNPDAAAKATDRAMAYLKEAAASGRQDAAGPASGGGGVPPPAQRINGQTYQTPKGPMVWDGDGWIEPPKR
jgi:hypothetical protein